MTGAARAVVLLALAASVAGNPSRSGVLSEIKALQTHLDGSAHATSKLQSGALGKKLLDTKLDSFSHTNSYGERVMASFWKVIIGVILFFSSFLFLYFVEGEACKSLVMMNHAKKACQKEITAEKVQRKYQNCMVHVTGPMTTETGQRDEDLGFTPADKCVVLKRTVEVLQWVEHKHKSDDTTTYEYKMEWKEDDVDSSGFQHPVGHQNNPRKHNFHSKKITSAQVKLQAFELKANVLEKLTGFNNPVMKEGMHTHKDFVLCEQNLMCGSGENPGDMKITYQVHGEGPVSICAVQTEDTFRRFLMERDGTVGGHDKAHYYDHVADEEPPPPESCCICATVIMRLAGAAFPHTALLVETGTVDKDVMFSNAQKKMLFGFIAMWLGIYLIFAPIAEILSFIPFVGGLLKSLFCVVAFLVAVVFTTVTIALAWIWFHPEMLAIILGAVGGLIYAHAANLIPGHSCVSGDPTDDPDACAQALLAGEILVAVAVVPLLYCLFLQIQEVRYWWALKTEMEAREKEDMV